MKRGRARKGVASSIVPQAPRSGSRMDRIDGLMSPERNAGRFGSRMIIGSWCRPGGLGVVTGAVTQDLKSWANGMRLTSYGLSFSF